MRLWNEEISLKDVTRWGHVETKVRIDMEGMGTWN